LLAVDLQAKFLESIWEQERVVRRARFLIEVANLLEIPVIATTQNASRLGDLHPLIAEKVSQIVPKMSFSCWKDPQFQGIFQDLNRPQVVIVGVETHICVGLTANDLLGQYYQVVVCPDAVSSSDQERHKLGMERLRDSCAMPIHTEAVAYEWMETADDPHFRSMLQMVKDWR
jgi:nicotinamidase-related amidase